MERRKTLRLLLVDDHRIIREGLRTLLGRHDGLEIVGEAEDGTAAVRLAAELSPDIVVMDITMPGLNGIDAARQILARDPRARVIALSMHADRRFVIGALKAGAAGYLLKDCASEEIARAVRKVAGGGTYLSATITDIVVKDYVAQHGASDSSAYAVLTAREREVLQRMAEGLSTKDIAFQLKVSVKTVETYRQQIMEKLDIHSVAELTKYAIREGLTAL